LHDSHDDVDDEWYYSCQDEAKEEVKGDVLEVLKLNEACDYQTNYLQTVDSSQYFNK
jgi:hypothetical protein